MAENTLLDKVLSLQDKYKKLEEQLADPEVIADMKKFVQLMFSRSHECPWRTRTVRICR